MPSFEDLQRINKANSIINRSNISIGLRPMYLHDDVEEQQLVDEKFYEEYYEEDFSIEEVPVSEFDSEEEFEFEKHNSLSPNLRREIKEKLLETQTRDIVTAEEYYLKKAQQEDQEYYEEHIEEEEYLEKASQENSYASTNFFDADELDAEPLFETAAKYKNTETLYKSQSPLSFSKTVMYTACAIIAAVYLIFTFKPVSTAPVTQTNFEETKLQELTKTVNSKEPRSLIITSGSFLNESEADSYQKALKDRLGVPLKLVKDGQTFSIQIGPAYANHNDALLVFDELSRYSVKNLSIKVAS
jgi:hypothetical protein